MNEDVFGKKGGKSVWISLNSCRLLSSSIAAQYTIHNVRTVHYTQREHSALFTACAVLRRTDVEAVVTDMPTLPKTICFGPYVLSRVTIRELLGGMGGGGRVMRPVEHERGWFRTTDLKTYCSNRASVGGCLLNKRETTLQQKRRVKGNRETEAQTTPRSGSPAKETL